MNICTEECTPGTGAALQVGSAAPQPGLAVLHPPGEPVGVVTAVKACSVHIEKDDNFLLPARADFCYFSFSQRAVPLWIFKNPVHPVRTRLGVFLK